MTTQYAVWVTIETPHGTVQQNALGMGTLVDGEDTARQFAQGFIRTARGNPRVHIVPFCEHNNALDWSRKELVSA